MLYELRDMIGRSGRVEEIYGGYEIAITDTEHFPWYKVIYFLLDSSFEVWMKKTELLQIDIDRYVEQNEWRCVYIQQHIDISLMIDLQSIAIHNK
jgi:hypothetical protein